MDYQCIDEQWVLHQLKKGKELTISQPHNNH